MLTLKRTIGASLIGAGLGIAAALLAGLLATGCAAVQKHSGTALDVARCVQEFVATGQPIDPKNALAISECIQGVLAAEIERHDNARQSLAELEQQRARLLSELGAVVVEPTHAPEPEATAK